MKVRLLKFGSLKAAKKVKKNKKTFEYVLTSNSKSVIINESSKTTQ